MSYRIALDLIQEFEGCHLTAYPDPKTGGQPWTIGWGSTYIDGKPVTPGQVITQAKADSALLGYVAHIANVLALKIPGWAGLNANQQAALLSFSYNVGGNWFGAAGFSTITRTIKDGRLSDVPAALLLYRNPGSSVEAGLKRRRIAEGALWNSEVKAPAAAAPPAASSNTAPITLEQLFRFYQKLPHQMAAITELDADLAANGAAALSRSRPWFKTWSAAGKQPDRNASPPYLRLTRTGKKDSRGLDLLSLERVKNGITMDRLTAVSGIPGAQAFRTGPASKTGSMEPLPEGHWRIGDIEWAGGRRNDYSGSWGPGLGATWVALTYEGTTSRSAIGIHVDENAVRSPGTAGCVGLLNKADEAKLVGILRADDPRSLFVDWGLGTCPKPS